MNLQKYAPWIIACQRQEEPNSILIEMKVSAGCCQDTWHDYAQENSVGAADVNFGVILSHHIMRVSACSRLGIVILFLTVSALFFLHFV